MPSAVVIEQLDVQAGNLRMGKADIVIVGTPNADPSAILELPSLNRIGLP
jgi:hypothetical protein